MGNNKVIEELDIPAPKNSTTPNNRIEKAIYNWIIKNHIRIQYHQVIR